MLPNAFLKRPVRRAGDLKYVILWVASIILTVYITNGMYKMDSGCDTMSPLSLRQQDKQDDLVEIVEIQEMAAPPPQLEVVVPQEIEIQAGGESSIRPDRNLPLIFVGGVPRSGTTLMRAMLDAHESVRCGEETHIIPRLIFSRHQWTGSKRERDRLASAGLTDEIIDSAVSSFILEIITKHGKPAERMCNKDPLLLRFAGYMKTLFPRGKFILMIRDGRAVIHSIITRKVTISGFDLTDFRDCMSRWNDMIEHMYAECTAVGPESCLPVYYEQLVLHPEANMKKILKFLNLPWDERVLHHEKFVAGGEIALSKMEKSTDQVVKPVNLEALTSWAGHIPDDVVAEMDQIAPMLRTLGYDPTANPPKYGEPDDVIKQNTHDVQVNKDKWLNIAKNYSIHAGKKPMLRFKDKDLEKLLA